MKRTILYALDSFEYGGVSSYVRSYQKAANGKHDVIILGMKGDIPDPARYFRGATVVEIPRRIRHPLLHRFLDSVPYVVTLCQLLKHHDVHIIHFSTPWSTLYCLLYFRTWLLYRVITYYGAQDLEIASTRTAGPSLTNMIGDTVRKHLQRFGLVASRRIVVFSEYALRQICNHYKLSVRDQDKIVVIPGCIDTMPKSPYRVGHHPHLTIVNIGRAEKRKGLVPLLYALRILKKLGFPYQAFIASPVWFYQNTDLLSIYENLDLFTQVHFIHAVSGKAKEKLLQSADVFVMPSLDLETFGLSMLESLSYGTPVIGTPVGAISEILTEVDPRLITKSSAAQAIAKKLIWFGSLKPDDVSRIRQRCRETVKNRYLLNAWKPRILSLYETHETVSYPDNVKQK